MNDGLVADSMLANSKKTVTILCISGQVDKESATETVDCGSIPDRVKLKTIKIGIHSFPAGRSAIKGTVWSLHHVW